LLHSLPKSNVLEREFASDIMTRETSAGATKDMGPDLEMAAVPDLV
jgi:hypothetical protein